MIWFYRLLLFFLSCFFILPFFKVEDPFRSLALRFFAIPGEAKIYNHTCEGDRVYLYQYTIKETLYQQRYDGYNEILDFKIPENDRCKGELPIQVSIPIKYYPHFRYWSEPLDAERLSFPLFFMVNLVKFAAIILMILTFVRKR